MPVEQVVHRETREHPHPEKRESLGNPRIHHPGIGQPLLPETRLPLLGRSGEVEETVGTPQRIHRHVAPAGIHALDREPPLRGGAVIQDDVFR